MATLNPFDLLDDDAEDPSQLIAAQPLKVEKAAPVQPSKAAKLPTKPLPPSQAVREAKNAPGGGRGGSGGGRGFGRGGGRGFNRDSRSNDAPGNENGYGGGYSRPSEEGARQRRGPVGGYRGGRGGGGRRGGFSNGESGDMERPPRRYFERHSGTGHGNEYKRDGAGRGNWGTNEDEISPGNEQSTTVVEKNVSFEKQEGEGEATDANKETSADEQVEKEPEDKEMTLEEYEKVLEEKRKALQATKIEERKVDTKVFESMQQLSNKKSNDEIFIKLGSEKDKRRDAAEKEEKAKKSVSINEFLKPAEGESYNSRGGYRGRGGRGRGGSRGGGASAGGSYGGRYGGAAAPAIEDTAQFPTLGK